jgi:hypothetical protein
VLPIHACAFGRWKQNGWEALSILIDAFGGLQFRNTINAKGSPSIQRFSTNVEHSSSPLLLLAPKALLKIWNTPYPKSLLSLKSCSRDGKYSPSIPSPMPSKISFKNGECSLSVIPSKHFCASCNGSFEMILITS